VQLAAAGLDFQVDNSAPSVGNAVERRIGQIKMLGITAAPDMRVLGADGVKMVNTPAVWRSRVHHRWLDGFGYWQGHESVILTTTAILPGALHACHGPSDEDDVPRVGPLTHITS